MRKNRLLLLLALLMTAATGAWAQETYKVTMKEGTVDADKWTIAPPEATTTGVAADETVTATYTGRLKVKGVKAVKKVVTDLSMVDNAGNERTDGQWTANCYMVHTAGDYKLPLVYGNAIKSGEVNAAAYTGVTGNDNATATFLRHDGQAIAAPWIKDNGITVASAELLWQDAQGLITAVDISGDYLTLTVGKDASEQEGNALVAAKDASGNVVWSWHIWVTKQTFASTDLTTIATGSHDYQVTPVNLGWVGDVVSQGYCTYYQWGRKDAFIPGTGTNTTNHTVYDISGTEVTNAITHSTADVGIADNIKNPTTFYRVSNKPNNTSFYNLWDAQQTNTGNIATATTKTVYDPCPAGFCVPTGNLYHYMGNGGNRSDTNWDGNNKGKTWTLDGANLYFPASGQRSPSSGSLGIVGSNGLYWSASANNSNGGRNLNFYSSGWSWSNYYMAYGFPVRAVAEEVPAVSLIVDPVVGQIIGSDGKNYDANATLPDGVTAVAKIFYVGSDAETSTTYNHGLALALSDVSGTQTWCSQTSSTCLTTQYSSASDAKADMAGLANTDALVGHGSHTHAAASAARGYNSGTHPTGTSAWFLPSAGQWDKMATAAGGYGTLKTNAGLQSGYYWSCSERNANVAWLFYSVNGNWSLDGKGNDRLVRACLAF